jgi:hypothetical protein
VAALGAGFAPADGWRWSAAVERRQERALAVHASPATGTYEPTIPAAALQSWRFGVEAGRVATAVQRSLSLRASFFAERDRLDEGAQLGDAGWLGRGTVNIEASARRGAGTLVASTLLAGLVGGIVASQRLVRLGGPVSAPGFAYHQFAGRAGLSQRVEWQRSVPFVPLRLGRFGRVPSVLTLAPFATAVWMDAPGTAAHGWRASAGLGVLAFFDQLRVDVARGGRGGRWTVGVDVSRPLWPIL